MEKIIRDWIIQFMKAELHFLPGNSRSIDLRISASLLSLVIGFLPYLLDKAEAIFIVEILKRTTDNMFLAPYKIV